MAPLDDFAGDTVLAERPTKVRRRENDGATTERRARDTRAPLPERRAVNWANALARIAGEIESQEGYERTEASLRAVGARMSRDMLTPLPLSRDEFEPAVNRALSSLDWGWVAILERGDTIVFEHRAPWPFEKRAEPLLFVLEGFYTDTLARLSGNDAMQVRFVGRRGGAMVFDWVPGEPAKPATADHATLNALPPDMLADANLDRVMAPSPTERVSPAPMTSDPVVDPVPPVAERHQAPEFHPTDHDDRDELTRTVARLRRRSAERAEASRETQPYFVMPGTEAAPRTAPAAPSLPQRPARVQKKDKQDRQISIPLVAATVFVVLLALGLMTGSGNVAGTILQRLGIGSASSIASAGALTMLEHRARAGDADAEIALGLRLARGRNADYGAAARWFRAAATRAGSAEAQYDLGVLTAGGLGVKRDPVEAAILFMSAASSGFPMAEYRLGLAFERGTGVARNGGNAAMWYERAARHGVRQAQSALAHLFATGTGVKADPVTAYAWYRLAEENGDPNATRQLQPLLNRMTPAQQAEARRRALQLIGDTQSARGTPVSDHPLIDQVLARR